MRKWKDEGKGAFPRNRKIIFTLITLIILFMTFIEIVGSRQITIGNLLNVSLSGFLLWGIYTSGFYKIMRKYAEWKLKKKDNHWRNYP